MEEWEQVQGFWTNQRYEDSECHIPETQISIWIVENCLWYPVDIGGTIPSGYFSNAIPTDIQYIKLKVTAKSRSVEFHQTGQSTHFWL